VTAGTGTANAGDLAPDLSYSATMTAPAAAGTYVYNVYTNMGSKAAGSASSATYTITVGSAPTTAPPTTAPPTTDPESNIPGAPTKVTATAGNRSATVSWDAPKDDGGMPIVGYFVVSSDYEAFAITEGAETTIKVPDLTNGKSYTFLVFAFNDGDNFGSEESAASNAVTPRAPSGPTPGATATHTATTPAAGDGGGATVIPVGAPDTGAGGASSTADASLAGLGGLALLIAGAGATQVIRRRQQV